MQPLVPEIKRTLEPVMCKYAIQRASLFGSFANGTAKPDSDIDLLVERSKPIGLLEFIHIKHELEDLFGRKVDLLEFKAVKPNLRNHIILTSIPIYGKAAA